MIDRYSRILGVDLSARSRKQEYTIARFAVWRRLWLTDKMSLTDIARLFGYNHTTIRHGIKTIETLLEQRYWLAVEYWEKVKDIEV